MNPTLSDRQRREREYYDQFSQLGDTSLRVDFKPVQGDEMRPWNSYWFFYQRVRELRRDREQRLLDFGCGPGTAAVLYATLGYDVCGFDISPNNVDRARLLAEHHKVADQIRLHVGIAEELPYPEDHFDVVAGIDVLHHVDIPRAVAECRRVLRPGGIALFHEPVTAPGFDTLRNTALMRRLVPNTASFERHVTHDERKLDARDLAAVKTCFSESTETRFWLLERLSRLVPGHAAQTALARIDRSAIRHWPAVGALGGVTVIELRKT